MTTPSAQLPPEAEDKLGPRFSSHVRVQDSGCWTWTGPHHEGYGRFRFERRTFAAHRFAYAEPDVCEPRAPSPDSPDATQPRHVMAKHPRCRRL